MDKNKADIYRAMVDMSSRDVQHDAFKYIKRWWKNGKWNYEYKDESKAKSTNKSVVVKREPEKKFSWGKTKTESKRQTAEELTRQAKNHGKHVIKDPKKSSDDQSKEKSALQTYREIKDTKPTVMKRGNPVKETSERHIPKRAAKDGSAVREEPNKIIPVDPSIQNKSFLNKLVTKAKNTISTISDVVEKNVPLRPLKDNLPSLQWKTDISTKEEDMAAVNPNYDPNDKKWRTNCAYCTLTYDLRRRGYDVTAKAQPLGPTGDVTLSNILDMYEGASILSVRDTKSLTGMKKMTDAASYEKTWDKLCEDMSKYPDGSRGHFCLYWNLGGGHDISWEKENGKITFRDAQLNKTMTAEEFMERNFIRCYDFKYIRTDDLTPAAECLKYVKNREKDKKRGSD